MDDDLLIKRALTAYFDSGDAGHPLMQPQSNGQDVVVVDDRVFVTVTSWPTLLAVCEVQADGQVILLDEEDWPASVVDQVDGNNDE